MVIQLDGYNLPREQVSEFFESFSKNVLKLEDYANSLEGNEFINGLEFSLNLDSI